MHLSPLYTHRQWKNSLSAMGPFPKVLFAHSPPILSPFLSISYTPYTLYYPIPLYHYTTIPYTLYPIPYTLYPIPYTLDPRP